MERAGEGGSSGEGFSPQVKRRKAAMCSREEVVKEGERGRRGRREESDSEVKPQGTAGGRRRIAEAVRSLLRTAPRGKPRTKEEDDVACFFSKTTFSRPCVEALPMLLVVRRPCRPLALLPVRFPRQGSQKHASRPTSTTLPRRPLPAPCFSLSLLRLTSLRLHRPETGVNPAQGHLRPTPATPTLPSPSADPLISTSRTGPAMAPKRLSVTIVGGGICKYSPQRLYLHTETAEADLAVSSPLSFSLRPRAAGIAQAVRLQDKLGKNVEFAIYERSYDVGGVWRDSTWPGTAVDVPIHLYCLYSHLNPSFTQKWAGQSECVRFLPV